MNRPNSNFNNQNNPKRTPKIQKIYKGFKWIVLGLTSLGLFYGAINHAIHVITPKIQIYSIILILTIWGVLEWRTKRKKVHWRYGNQLLNINGINAKIRFFFVGLLLFQLIPFFIVKKNAPLNSRMLPISLIDSLQIRNENIKEEMEHYKSLYEQILKSVEETNWAADTRKNINELINEGKLQTAIHRLTTIKQFEDKKIDKHNKNKAKVAFQIALIREMLLDYSKAENEFNEAIKLDSLNTAYPGALGNLLFRIGRYPEAKHNFQRAYQLALNQNHLRDAIMAECLNNLAAIFFIEGNYKESISYFKMAIAIYQTNAQNKNSLAGSISNLSYCYQLIGDYGKAISYAQQSLEIYLSLNGKNSKDVADSYDMIGSSQLGAGNFCLAIESFTKALKSREFIFENNHPDLALSYNNLGAGYYKIADYPKSLSHYEIASHIRTEVYGSGHPLVAETLCNQGVTFLDMGESRKAEELISESLRIRQKVFGKNHLDTANSLLNLSKVQYELSAFEDAQYNATKALEIHLSQLGEKHQSTQKNYSTLGKINYTASKSSEKL